MKKLVQCAIALAVMVSAPAFAADMPVKARPVVVDLRNIYRPEDMAALGFIYESVGRRSEPRE